jgi:integrase
MSKILTAQAVAKLRPSDNYCREVPDAGCPGLYLQIYPSGKKSWALRFRRPGDGRSAKLVLGSVNATSDAVRDPDPVIGGHLTLAGARRLAGLLRHTIAMGKDPAADYQSHKLKLTLTAADNFTAAASDFITQHAKKKTRRWQEQAKLLGLREVDGELALIDRGLAARWQDKPIREIDADIVFRLIEETRNKGVPGLERKNTDASEPRARSMFSVLSKMFSWLLEKRRVDGNPLAVLKRPSAPKARERALDDAETVALWRAAEGMSEPFRTMIKLLLLTGCRLNEVGRMERTELSSDLAMWTIPGTRTKNHRTHVVPLSPIAQSLLSDLDGLPECRFVFSTNQKTPVSGFSKMKRRLDALMPNVPPWRIHDLRRTCATGMAEIGIAPHVIELCLNHISGARAGVAGIYNRSVQMPERRAAMERWASHVEGLVSGKPATVVSIKKRGAKRGR